MKIVFIIVLAFSLPLYGFSQSLVKEVRFKMEGTWKERGESNNHHRLNRISFGSDTTGNWSTEGTICDCEFFKIYEENDKVFIRRLIILDGWSDPIEIISVNTKELVVRHLDNKVYRYKRKRSRRSHG